MVRLIRNRKGKDIICRTIHTRRNKYIKHLKTISDWDGKKASESLIKSCEETLPETFWMVEFSLPELYPANRHKLGEILLRDDKEISPKQDYSLFLYARIPRIVISLNLDTLEFNRLHSDIAGHVELFSF